MAEGDRLLHEERRRHVLGRALEPPLPGRIVDRHGAHARGARRRGHAAERARRAGGSRRRSVSQRWHRLHHSAAGRAPDVRAPARRRPAGAAPTGNCGGAVRSTFRSFQRRLRSESRATGRSTPRASCSARLHPVRSKPPRRPQSLVGGALADEQIEAAAELAARPARPMDNTDFSLIWRKRMVREFVTYALREVRGDDVRELRRRVSRATELSSESRVSDSTLNSLTHQLQYEDLLGCGVCPRAC